MKPDSFFHLEHAAWPAFLVDASGTIRKANAAAVHVLGTVMEGESALSATIWSPENELSAEEFLARLDRSSSPARLVKLRGKGGATVAFHAYVCPLAREGYRDHLFQLFPEPAAPAAAEAADAGLNSFTPAAQADASLAQRQKLDCALQLTRTVALDFNNVLTTILGHTSLVLSRMEPTHAWRASLLEVEKSAEHGAEIAQDLAEFSRQDKDRQSLVPGNVNRLARHAVEVLQKPSTSNVHWALQLEKRPFTVTLDEAKMQQAFVRILDNAVEAIKANGRITVRTLNYAFTEPVVSQSVRLEAGHYVCVEIVDTGPGIPKEVLPRIFEPFFTTKPAPHRGLGLAWVYGIVTNHGGVVGVTAPPGQGTTVRIFLPAQEKIAKDQPTRVDDLRGEETILFVDDEPMLVNLGRTVLSAFGYKVLPAGGGPEALDAFDQVPGEIDLVVTDLVMPGMSGRELVDQLQRRQARVPILYTSGYVRAVAETEGTHYLRKPFTSQDLLRKVKQVLHPADFS